MMMIIFDVKRVEIEKAILVSTYRVIMRNRSFECSVKSSSSIIL
jgi:hypothetical protein